MALRRDRLMVLHRAKLEPTAPATDGRTDEASDGRRKDDNDDDETDGRTDVGPCRDSYRVGAPIRWVFDHQPPTKNHN